MRRMLVLLAAGAALLGSFGPAAAAGPAPSGGTIAMRPKTANGDYDPALQAFEEAAAAAFGARGFTVLGDTGHAAYVAELVLSRSDVGTAKARVPAERAQVIGAGIFVPLPTGKSQLVSLQRTQLEMRIHRRDDPAILWDGSAMTVREAGTPKGADAIVARDLSAAVLGAYPAAPQGVLGVP